MGSTPLGRTNFWVSGHLYWVGLEGKVVGVGRYEVMGSTPLGRERYQGKTGTG